LGIAGIIKLAQSFTFKSADVLQEAKVMAASAPLETTSLAKEG